MLWVRGENKGLLASKTSSGTLSIFFSRPLVTPRLDDSNSSQNRRLSRFSNMSALAKRKFLCKSWIARFQKLTLIASLSLRKVYHGNCKSLQYTKIMYFKMAKKRNLLICRNHPLNTIIRVIVHQERIKSICYYNCLKCVALKKKLKLTSTDLLTLNNKEIFRKGRDIKIMQYVL